MKAKRRRKNYHHGSLPAALVDVTKELIAERGLEGFTLREVARRVGVTHVAAYRHYADRRALLAAVSEYGHRVLHRRLLAARSKAPDSLEPRLRAIMAAYIRFCWDEPALAAVMFGPRLSREGEHPGLEKAATDCLDVVTETIATLAPSEALRGREPLDLALGLWALVHGFTKLSYDKGYHASARAATRAFDDTLTPMLAGMFGALKGPPGEGRNSNR